MIQSGNGRHAKLAWEEIPIADRSLAIVGSNPKTRELAPYDDESFEIWLFNEAAQKSEVYRRWDALLQIHLPEVYSSPVNWINTEHWNWLQQDHGKRIYMIEVDARVPNSVKYPLEGVLSLIPYRYLRSSPAMALGLAIYLGYRHIQMYGSDFISNTEYQYQAINLAYWIGLAHGKGIDLDMRCWQDEFEQPIYGFEGEAQIGKIFIEERRAEQEKGWKTNDLVLKRVKEKIDQAMLEFKPEAVAKQLNELEMVALAAGESAAAMAEAERYLQRSDPISRQEFERMSAQAQQDGEGIREKMFKESGKVEYVWNVWKQTGLNEALNQLRQFIKNYGELAYDTGAQLGIFHENMLYLGEYDKRVTAMGGPKALEQINGIEEAV